MCLRLYLNGDGTGRGTHLSLFFVVMRGKCDALLKWPFSQKVGNIPNDPVVHFVHHHYNQNIQTNVFHFLLAGDSNAFGSEQQGAHN